MKLRISFKYLTGIFMIFSISAISLPKYMWIFTYTHKAWEDVGIWNCKHEAEIFHSISQKISNVLSLHHHVQLIWNVYISIYILTHKYDVYIHINMLYIEVT